MGPSTIIGGSGEMSDFHYAVKTLESEMCVASTCLFCLLSYKFKDDATTVWTMVLLQKQKNCGTI